MRIVYCYSYDEGLKDILKLNGRGLKIIPVNIPLESGIKKYKYMHELEKLYNKKEKKLLEHYNKIKNLSKTADILIVNQINVYVPEFLETLNIYKVFVSGDDPESSNICSKTHVKYFDYVLSWGVYYNRKELIIEKFKQWGAKKTAIWPYGVCENKYDQDLSPKKIAKKKRNIDIIYIGTIYLKKLLFLLILKSHFKEKFQIYGYCAPWYNLFFKFFCGYKVKPLPNKNFIGFYQQTKIGINKHLSYGPSNIRMYEIPANGALLITDNEKGTKRLFNVGKEVICYNNIFEAVRLIDYYLKNEDKRKKIAIRGFKRVIKDYTRKKTFLNLLENIKKEMLKESKINKNEKINNK